MKLGLALGAMDRRVGLDMGKLETAERLGYDSVWVPEAWGTDAVTIMAWIAARTTAIRVASGILQIPARTPAMTAMTAVTLSELSGGRFILGLGMSGPQVAEGWHGVAYGRPIQRTREYVEIVRRAISGSEPLEFSGDHYSIPATGPGTTGLGKPLTMSARPKHPVPIYLAALGPNNVALAAEIADGWIPTLFSPERFEDVFSADLRRGFKAAVRPDDTAFEIAPMARVAVGDDVDGARERARATLALYIGGMGARGRNFYNDLVGRYGYAGEARHIQTRYLSGDRRGAVRAVPDRLVDEVNLIGTRREVRDRLASWRAVGVGTLVADIDDERTLNELPELLG